MTDAPECKNDSATCTGIDAGLTQPRSGFDLETTRRDLIAMRGMIHLTTDCSKAPIGQATTGDDAT